MKTARQLKIALVIYLTAISISACSAGPEIKTALINSCADKTFWPPIRNSKQDTLETKRQILRSNVGREAFCGDKV